MPIIGEEGAAGWQAWVLKLTGGSAPDELASIPPSAGASRHQNSIFHTSIAWLICQVFLFVQIEEAEDLEEEEQGGWGGWEPLEPLHRPEDAEEDGGEAKAAGGDTDEDSDDASDKEAEPDIGMHFCSSSLYIASISIYSFSLAMLLRH